LAVKTKPKKKRKVIGWREIISLPDLGVPAIKVKVDTGAATSALHATGIRYVEQNDGQTWVSFVIIEHLQPRKSIRVRAPLVEQRKVTSSMGHASIRPVIRTNIQLGELHWPIEITLVNRDPMGFRMLLGRRALKNRFLVNPTRSFVQSQPREDL
jgi:hypothetical protein